LRKHNSGLVFGALVWIAGTTSGSVWPRKCNSSREGNHKDSGVGIVEGGVDDEKVDRTLGHVILLVLEGRAESDFEKKDI